MNYDSTFARLESPSQDREYWESNRGSNNIKLLSINPLKFVPLPGEYSCLQVDLTFKRQLSFFIVTVCINQLLNIEYYYKLSYQINEEQV